MPVCAFSGRRNGNTTYSIRADSGNIDRHTRKVTRAMGVTSKPPASPTIVKKGGGRHGRCSICRTAKDRKTDWKCY